MVYRYNKNTKIFMSLSPRCTARSPHSRALLIIVMVESSLLVLGSCATPIVLEQWGEGKRKTPLT
jgi:hypothetical protein